MSLFKQIAIVVFLAFLLLFVLVAVDNSKQSGTFLRGQLQTAAQDTATVLGIAISTTGSGADVAALETLFNAVFDSGYYSQIRLVAANGDIVHQKQRNLIIQGVPNWFVQMVPLNTAKGSAEVMQGWLPLGRLELTLHPGFAYASLYENLKTTLLWFAALFMLVMLLLWYVLRIVLKPLKAIYRQANAIQNNEFIQQSTIPKTVELRRVVEAMNQLVAKVQAVFKDQEETLSRYQALLYRDELTGLYNRRFILSELHRVLSESAAFNGCMSIVKVRGIDELRQQKGYKQVDNIIKMLAEIIDTVLKARMQSRYARINDNEFALLLPTNSTAMEDIITDIFAQFADFASQQNLHSSIYLVAGGTDVHNGYSHGKILAELDLSLVQAQAAGSYQQRYALSTELILPEGKMQWRQWFKQVLQDERFYLVAQSVFSLNKQLLHQEVFIRVNDSKGEQIPAGIFMPMAQSLGYGLDIDRSVFALLKKVKLQNEHTAPIAFNLSPAFFSHADGFAEFKQLLAHYKKQRGQLCIEASHAALQQYPERCLEIFTAVKQAGQHLGVDQLDLNAPMQILQTIKPDYVKINAKVLDDISGHNVESAYQALRSLTNTLDIQLIAVGIDEPDLYQRLQALHIDGVQGNLLSQPEMFL